MIMKTKNIITILAMLPVVALFTGCSSDEEQQAKPAKEILRVMEGGVVLPAKTSAVATDPVTATVSVSADCEWEVLDRYGNKFGTYPSYGFGTKLSVTPLKGVGNGNLTVSVSQNTNVYERKDTFMLRSAGGLQQLVTIRQLSGSDNLSISDDMVVFPTDDTTPQPFTVTSNVGFTIQVPTSSNWFKVTENNVDVNGTALGAGAHIFSIAVDPAVSDARRTAKFFVNTGTTAYPVEVMQEGLSQVTLSVQSSSDIVVGSGGEKMVWIESNAEWHAYVPSSVSWVFVEPPTGVGNGELRLFCEPNSTGSSRMTAIVIIAGSKNPKQEIVLVEQSAASDHQDYLSVWDFYSTWVGYVSASFRYNYESNKEVHELGLVYSTSISVPSLENGAESMMLSQKPGLQGTAEGHLENLQPMTTYYVRAFAMGAQGIQYSPNVITIVTGQQGQEGSSDTPWQ
jgi:hypothetical protein